MAHLRWNGPAIGRGRQVEAGGELEKIGKATDVFALGAILCEILTGSPPYQHGEDDPLGEAFVSLIVQRAKAGDVKPGLTRLAACESDPELAEMVRIAQDCLAPQPQDRPVDAAHVNHRIANYRADVRKRAEEERVERGKRQELEQRIRAEKKAMRRTRALVVLVAIIAIAAVVVALVFWDQSEVNRRLAVEKDFALTASETRRIALEARTAELRRSQSETETALRDALRREARVALERGLAQCQRREHGAGLLWLVRGLRGLPPDSNDLEHALRANLACWKQPLLTLQKMLPSSAPVNAIAFHPSKSWLGVAADDGKVVLWDVVTEKILAVFPHPRPVRAVAFRTDGDQLLTGCDDGCVRLWVPGANASPRVIAAHSAPLLAIAYHPREDLFLTGANDGSAVLWDGTAGTRKHFFNAHQRAVQAVAFAPHGRKALTASHDRTARIWDVTNGHELFLLHHNNLSGPLPFTPNRGILTVSSLVPDAA